MQLYVMTAWRQYLRKLISHIATYYVFYVGSRKTSQKLRLHLHRGIHTLPPCKQPSQFIDPSCEYTYGQLSKAMQQWLGTIIIGIKLSILMWRFLCVWPLDMQYENDFVQFYICCSFTAYLQRMVHPDPPARLSDPGHYSCLSLH